MLLRTAKPTRRISTGPRCSGVTVAGERFHMEVEVPFRVKVLP